MSELCFCLHDPVVILPMLGLLPTERASAPASQALNAVVSICERNAQD